MNMLPAPLLVLLLALSLGYGAWITRMRDAASSRRHAIAAATLSLLLGSVIAALDLRGSGGLWVDPLLATQLHPLLGVDNASALLLPVVSLMTLAWIVTLPRQRATPQDLGVLLMLQATLHGQLAATDLAVYALCAIGAALVPLEDASDVALRRLRRVVLIPGAALLGVAAGIVLLAGLDDPMEATAHGAWATTPAGWVVFALMAASTVLRLGLFPAQWWLGAAMSRGRLPRLALVTFAMPAAWLLHRALGAQIMAEPHWGEAACWLGAATAILGALMALTQRDLRRLLAMMALTQIGMVVTGLSSGVLAGSVGGLMLWLGAALSLTGLAITVKALHLRLGTTDLRELGGVGIPLPRLSLAFLVFGLMSTGLPGTLDYVGDELVFEGAIHAGIGPALLSVLALGLSAMAILRAWSAAFIGPRAPSAHSRVGDLRRGERLVLGALVLTLVGLGLAPHWLVSTEARAVELPAAATHSVQVHPSLPSEQP